MQRGCGIVRGAHVARVAQQLPLGKLKAGAVASELQLGVAISILLLLLVRLVMHISLYTSGDTFLFQMTKIVSKMKDCQKIHFQPKYT